jgi:hypothetical protein
LRRHFAARLGGDCFYLLSRFIFSGGGDNSGVLNSILCRYSGFSRCIFRYLGVNSGGFWRFSH